jgi:signal transduction histidine kinase
LRRARAIAYPRQAVALAGVHASILTFHARTLPPSALPDAAVAEHPRDRPAAHAPLWRRAFAGITPQAIAIIAALLAIRGVSATADQLVAVANFAQLAAYAAFAADGMVPLSIRAATMIVVIVATSNLGPSRGARRIVALACAVLVGSVLGIVARMAYGDWFVSPDWAQIRSFAVYVWPRYLLIAALLTVVVELHRRERFNIGAAQQAEIDNASLERELAAAQLQALHAQIEPHFLFNTLANVRRLYDEDRAGGRKMLEMLMRYIEVALPDMRGGRSTLAREAELIEAYLHIQRVRMGPRLAFAIDIPRALGDLGIPPMMLLTLVENAIKHGLTPSPEGGRIRVAAHVGDEQVVLTVADTGVGFGSGSGTGIGLANISARLASQFGDRAELLLENNELGGATASIVLPLERARS